MHCACGCGDVAPIITYNAPKRGYVKGERARFISGHNSRGKGTGWYFDHTKNRMYVIARDGSRNAYYRIVAGNMIGRKVRNDEEVHHLNGDSTDDRPENLSVLPVGRHRRLHYASRTLDEKGRLLPVA
jgi:hypothetical protein